MLFHGKPYRVDNQINTIYAILDHEMSVRYVGQTSGSLFERANNHIALSKIDTRPISLWFRSNADRFMMQPLELVLYRDTHAAEYAWIRKFRSEGYDLLNILPYEDSRQWWTVRGITPLIATLDDMERAA
jgi:hypothetical protein